MGTIGLWHSRDAWPCAFYRRSCGPSRDVRRPVLDDGRRKCRQPGACYAMPEISISFVGVPDIGRELPVAADLAPHDDVFASDFLRRLALGLERDGADLARRAQKRWPWATIAQISLRTLVWTLSIEGARNWPSRSEGASPTTSGWGIDQRRSLRPDIRPGQRPSPKQADRGFADGCISWPLHRRIPFKWPRIARERW